MKSILITCVNYNTNNRLETYLKSIEEAAKQCKVPIQLEVVIADNSDKLIPIKSQSDMGFKISHIDNKGNFGYFGGISQAIKSQRYAISDYDYYIISNVDVSLDISFFQKLVELQTPDNLGWIAPGIVSEKEKRDRNPKIISRPSLRKMQITALFYKFPVLHFLYEKLIYSRGSKQEAWSGSNPIYAGHGSFIILTRAFTQQYSSIDFPSFLFGEEIFIAELNRKAKLQTWYLPEILVHDFDHASTSKMKRSSYYRMNYDSIKTLTSKFFTNEEY